MTAASLQFDGGAKVPSGPLRMHLEGLIGLLIALGPPAHAYETRGEPTSLYARLLRFHPAWRRVTMFRAVSDDHRATIGH
ncbi:MAG TPA: hypothetical protein H9881_02075 [Candidatus Stackebrandtia excrementipullorum]|nr:hypothetical protein [Candidatus Stackebrandtia excrementipullorum]